MTIPTGTLVKGVDEDGREQFLRVDDGGNLVISDEGGATMVGLGSQQLSVGTVVVALTVPAGTKRMFASVSGTAGESLRFKVGTNPTSTVGTKVVVGDYLNMIEGDWSSVLTAIRFIRNSTNTANAVLDIEYFS